jgi:hypothetical protein
MYKIDPVLKAINAEYNALLTPEARIRFLVAYSGLPSDRVAPIDSIGSPWPGTLEREAQEATEAGIELSRYITGLSPLIDMDEERLEEKMAAFGAAIERGKIPEPIPQFGELRGYIIQVAQSVAEDIETVDAVHEAVLAYHRCILELLKKATERIKTLKSNTG